MIHWLPQTLLPYLWAACSITRGRIFPFQQILLHFPGWMDSVQAHRRLMLCVLDRSSPRPNPSCVSSGQWPLLSQARFPPPDGEPGVRR